MQKSQRRWQQALHQAITGRSPVLRGIAAGFKLPAKAALMGLLH
ncbi:MAG: hypothetical protein PF630_02110 [Gammaproteobacteria bacterium]|jgi:hypothetical protein|nr:hypothetical protein [Gammaproteobacteria bacterium]